MDIGSLRHLVTVQQLFTTQDTFGQQSQNWTDLFVAWARVAPLSGRELQAAQAIQSETTHTVTLRYRAELANPKTASTFRVNYGGRLFNITGIVNMDERNRILVLTAVEGLTDG